MSKIKKTTIIGMGALGLLFGNQIAKTLGDDKVCFVADEKRVKNYCQTVFTINGEEKTFTVKTPSEATPADLVIIATKYNHLDEVLDIMKNCVEESTTIISVINGISSEEILAERYGAEKVIYTVAQGMDAVKNDGEFTYTHPGELRIGKTSDIADERFAALVEFLEKAQIPFTIEEDITHRMWGKFMLNVGINQVCMAYEATYSQALNGEEEFKIMCGAMREVMAIAHAKGIELTEQDFDGYIALMASLDPNATPSMRQDGIKKRPSEVEMFAGKIVELGKEFGISVPFNEMLYKRVKEIEATY